MGRSKETFHSGFRVLVMVGVDCPDSPRLTTRNYVPHQVSPIWLPSNAVGSGGKQHTGSLVPDLSLAARFLPLMTVVLRTRPF